MVYGNIIIKDIYTCILRKIISVFMRSLKTSDFIDSSRFAFNNNEGVSRK